MTIDEQIKYIDDILCYTMPKMCDDGICKDKDGSCPVQQIRDNLEELKQLRNQQAEGRVRSMEHDGCKGCKYEKCSMESKECMGCKQNSVDKYKRMTQGDRIRSMSDEELAEFIRNLNECCLAGAGMVDCSNNTDYIDCKGFVLEWLQSEVEE